MSDDLVKRLRAIDKDIVVRRFDPEMSFDGMTAHKAADRIEKLTAALNCNLPDYDPKIGIVGRLRQLGNWRVDGTKSSPIYNKSADHIEKLEAALREIAWIATPDHAMARSRATHIARKALEDKQ